MKSSLFRSFSDRSVVVRLTDPDRVPAAVAAVRDSGNDLFCVILALDRPLSEADLPEAISGIPIALMVPALGHFRDVAARLDLLRGRPIRVYLPCNRPENISALHVLSSLQIQTCADMRDDVVDWERVTDLMTYAVAERAPHAAIEPFSFIASNYDPMGIVAWGACEFDDPSHFLHLDANGRVALSSADLGAGKFVAQSPGDVETDAVIAAIRDRNDEWRRFFVDNHPCTRCAGWKVCLGKYADRASERRGCSLLFSELIDTIRVMKAPIVPAREDAIWQP